MIRLNERGQHAVEPLGKFLPPGIAVGGKRDKALRQTDLPLPFGGDELVVAGRALRHGLAVYHLRRQLLELFFVLRIDLADPLLKVGGSVGLDLQDLGEAQLADDLDQLAFGINHTFGIGKHGTRTFPAAPAAFHSFVSIIP